MPVRQDVTTALSWLLWGLVVVFVVSLLVGHLLGQPVLLSYVETGSMAPTLEPGDAFVAVPAAVSGEIEPGDVVVFRATVLEGGGLTTHRVVAERDGGYVTRGDANVATDQDGGEPLVSEGQIVATAWQVGGVVVVIPKLGLLAMAVSAFLTELRLGLAGAIGHPGLLGSQGFALGLFAIGIATYAVATVTEENGRRDRRRRRRRADTVDVRWLVVALSVGVAVAASLSMAVPVGPQEFELVSAENDAPGPRVVQTGTTETLTYTVPGGGLLPAVVVLEPASDGLRVEPDRVYVRGGETRDVTVTVTAPPVIGYAPQYLVEHRYLAVVPTAAIDRLYALHPWLPVLVIDALLAGGFALLSLAWLGGGQLRLRSRTRPLSALDRLERWWG